MNLFQRVSECTISRMIGLPVSKIVQVQTVYLAFRPFCPTLTDFAIGFGAVWNPFYKKCYDICHVE
jgi:hypothetical protein